MSYGWLKINKRALNEAEILSLLFFASLDCHKNIVDHRSGQETFQSDGKLPTNEALIEQFLGMPEG